MSVSEAAHGQAVIRQPDDGLTLRQPIPANGHADPKPFSGNTNFETLSARYQTVAMGRRVCEHSRSDQAGLQI